MNRKHYGCKVEGCEEPHRRNGYCTNHSQKAIRGTLEIYPHTKLCTYPGCFRKYYCSGYCTLHRNRAKDGIPLSQPFDTRNRFYSNPQFEHKSIDQWSRAVKQIVGDKCMNCGWDEASCDTHHIVPKREGGKNTFENAVVLCPNCHRLAHRKKLTTQKLQLLKEEPTGALT